MLGVMVPKEAVIARADEALYNSKESGRNLVSSNDGDNIVAHPHGEEEPQENHTPYVREGRKIGRNEPCPCGSGKKYKQCHGRLE